MTSSRPSYDVARGVKDVRDPSVRDVRGLKCQGCPCLTEARPAIASSECPTASVQAAGVSASGLQAASGKTRWLVIDPDEAWCLRDGITLAPSAARQRARPLEHSHRAELESGKVTDRIVGCRTASVQPPA